MKFLKNRDLVFLSILLILGVLTFLVIRPYIFTFILALVFVFVFDPIYKKINQLTKKPFLASGITTALIALLIIIPIILIGITAFYQATALLAELQQQVKFDQETVPTLYSELINSIPDNLAVFRVIIQSNEKALTDVTINLVGTVSGIVGNNVLPWIGNGIQLIVNSVVFLATLVYLFPTKDNFLRYIEKLNPIGKRKHTKFVQRFIAVTSATLKSLVLIAGLQGLFGWLIYTAVGLPASTFLGVLQAFVSFIPLGSGVLWVPISILLIITGSWMKGVIVFCWGLFVISTLDNVVRPLLLKNGKAALPELVTMFSALGGIALFGFWGFLFGPLIAALFLTAVDIYQTESEQITLKEPPES